MSSWAVNSLRRIATDIRSFEDGRMSQDAADSFILSLDLVYRELLVHEHSATCSRACTMINGALGNLRRLQNRVAEDQQPSVVHTGFVGRPSFDIPQEQVRELVENGFTGPQMAGIVGVSLSTIRRRIRQFGLSGLSEYDAISDSDLDIVVQEIEQHFPTCIIKQMLGHLQSRGFRIQHIRVREAMRRVDPEGSVMRRLSTINRRKYRVPAPSSLWHMDGNHKLIR